MGWIGNTQVWPSSVLLRMNPPPPARNTVLGDWSHSAFTSARPSSLRFTGVKVPPPFVLFHAAPSAPATQTRDALTSSA